MIAPATATNSTATQAEQLNPLDDYDSYTYCLSLHLLKIDEYNNLNGSGKETDFISIE